MEAEGNAGRYPGVVNRNACWRMIVTRLGVGAAQQRRSLRIRARVSVCGVALALCGGQGWLPP